MSAFEEPALRFDILELVIPLFSEEIDSKDLLKSVLE